MSDLVKLRLANHARQKQWAGSEKASDLEFRTIEFAGEAGEVSDAVKKLLRSRRGIAGNVGKTDRELWEALREEIGDALISLDMLADAAGIDLQSCIVDKFNKTSIKVGIPVFMDPRTLDVTDASPKEDS